MTFISAFEPKPELDVYTYICPMKLEEEIKQEKFKSMREKALVNLFFTANHFSLEQNRMLKCYDISIQQFNILRILKGQYPDPASVKLLMNRMLDKTSNASRLVEKLHAKGLVERRPCENDRRQVDVMITEKGLNLINSATADMDKMISSIPLDEPKAKELSDLLDLVRGRTDQ